MGLERFEAPLQNQVDGLGCEQADELALACGGVIRMDRANERAGFPEALEDPLQLIAEPRGDAIAERYRQQRADPLRRDGHGERSAPHAGRNVEIAQVGHIGHVAEDSEPPRIAGNMLLNDAVVRGCYDKGRALEIARRVGAHEPLESRMPGELGELRGPRRGDRLDLRATAQELLGLVKCDGAAPYDQASTPFELQECGVQGGRQSLNRTKRLTPE